MRLDVWLTDEAGNVIKMAFIMLFVTGLQSTYCRSWESARHSSMCMICLAYNLLEPRCAPSVSERETGVLIDYRDLFK